MLDLWWVFDGNKGSEFPAFEAHHAILESFPGGVG